MGDKFGLNFNSADGNPFNLSEDAKNQQTNGKLDRIEWEPIERSSASNIRWKSDLVKAGHLSYIPEVPIRLTEQDPVRKLEGKPSIEENRMTTATGATSTFENGNSTDRGKESLPFSNRAS